MKKVFVDTNIVIDLLTKREPFWKDAATLFAMADKGHLELHISALTLATTNYILSKSNSKQETRKAIRAFKVLVKIIYFNDKIINLALNDEGFSDFEDGLQYYSALAHDQELIISRNQRDFTASQIPVLSAREFLKSN